MFFQSDKVPGRAPREPILRSRATSDHSGKSLKVTRRKRKRVTRLSGAERQRRWRQRHREAHKAQQREYRRRKRQAQKEADALEASAQRQLEYQEARDRVAAAQKVAQEREARKTEAFRLAKAAGLGMEAWLKLPEAENWADMKNELIASERLRKEVAQVWEQLGYDPFTGEPLRKSQTRRDSSAPVPERALTVGEAWAARVRAAEWERLRALEELRNHTLANGMIVG